MLAGNTSNTTLFDIVENYFVGVGKFGGFTEMKII